MKKQHLKIKNKSHIIAKSITAEKNSSLNITELFKNCEYRYFRNEVKETLQSFHDKNILIFKILL